MPKSPACPKIHKPEGINTATGAAAPACPWVRCVAVVQCPLRRPGASCLSLSSRAVGKSYSRTGTRGSQGWRPACIGSVFRERAYPAAPCRSTDIKQARPAYPFCTFLSPFPTGKGLRGQIRRPIPENAHGKRGTAEKVKILVFTGFAGTGRKCTDPFLRHRRKWDWKWE